MKILLDTIDVQCHNQVPTLICWRGGVYYVEHILETWTYRSDWWTGKEDVREYMLLETSNGVIEVYNSNEGWKLSRMYD
jgi:hypothetical protein